MFSNNLTQLAQQMRIDSYYQAFLDLLATYGVKVLGSLIILVIAYFISRGAMTLVAKSLSKFGVDLTLNNFLTRLGKVIILGVGVLAALGNLGIDTTSFVALFTACSFAIGFAFKETLSNIAAGVLVIIFRPFVLGDYIKCGVGEGRVADVNLFSISLLTAENTTLIIPNQKVLSDVITNFTREKRRKITFVRTCAPAELCEIKTAAAAALSQNAYKLADSEVIVEVIAVNAADVNVQISFYCASENYDAALASANETLAAALLSKE